MKIKIWKARKDCFERISLNLFSNPTTESKFRILGLTDICKLQVFPNYSHLVIIFWICFTFCL